jgi:hypothetical protein
MGNAIYIYLVSDEPVFNNEFEKQLNKDGKLEYVVCPDDNGHATCYALGKRLKLIDPSLVSLWFLNKEGNIVKELYYSHKPKRKAMYRVVTDLNEMHRLRMKHGAWTDRIPFARKGNSYAERHAK